MNIGSATALDTRQTRRYCLNNLQDPESMDKDLICAICQDLVHEPLECIKCQHVFCTECIEDWQKKKDKCPFDCKGVLELQNVHRFVRNCLLKLRVSCPDCKEVFALEKAPSHEKECQYAKIECDNFGCTVLARRKSMEKHKMGCEFSDKNNCKKCIYLKQFFTQELRKTQQELIECKKLLKIEIQDKGKLLQQQQKQTYGTIQYCNQGHQLYFFDNDYNWLKKQYNQYNCSICNQVKYCRYQCKQQSCQDARYCTSCRPLKFDRIYCPNRHKLKPRNVSETHMCDVCQLISQNNFNCTMHCSVCNVDICSNCYDKLETNHHY